MAFNILDIRFFTLAVCRTDHFLAVAKFTEKERMHMWASF